MFMCAGENLVSKSSRQVEAVTGSRAGEDKDGGSRTSARIAPRHALLYLRSTWISPVTGRIGARHRPDRGPSLQPPGGRDGLARWSTDLPLVHFCRQRRRLRFPSLASYQVESLQVQIPLSRFLIDLLYKTVDTDLRHLFSLFSRSYSNCDVLQGDKKMVCFWF